MPVVKGGVWTNIEDEILKASVSKYGLNQWARVSSLLARKTPKQCKARWNEWLDPSIKKIEWSRAEDEKLLHLAKVLSPQWRDIARGVGRTANQCLERYQRLLDEAEKRETSALGLAGSEGGETQAPSADDVRRLRPGETDPDPETKPARPDTVDLDEDEKEMLSEARARLANTQGKKAKRKARERQQEEARRLASLQKRRELKGAGINIRVTTVKKGQMDYNADIPFQKKPMPGFHDTSEEMARNEYQRINFDPKKLQLGDKRKGEQDEYVERKKRKNNTDAPSASMQAALRAGQMQKIREAEQSHKRRPLSLPAPQVGDGELEEIVKMGMIGERAGMMARERDNNATRGLIGNYSNLHSGAPVRTPMAPAQEDHITNEIHNIRAMQNTQSSLLGGENTPLREGVGFTGFEGATPRKNVIATPNPLATPLRARGIHGSATPLRPGQTPQHTPRDGFALNSDGAMVTSEQAMRQQLKAGLASLPRPKNTDWELELPEEQAEARTSEERQKDAAERDRRERDIGAAQEMLERKRRTQVLQRQLPRPAIVEYYALLEHAQSTDAPTKRLVAQEATLLMATDAAKFPVPNPGGPKPTPPPTQLHDVSDAALAEARLRLLSETGQGLGAGEIRAAFEAEASRSLLRALGLYDEGDEEGEVRALRGALEDTNSAMLALAEKANALESKLKKHLGGYKSRAEMLRGKIEQAAEQLEKATYALTAFKMLQRNEQAALQTRLGALREEVSFVSTRERKAQEAYRRTKEELDGLLAQEAAGAVNGY